MFVTILTTLFFTQNIYMQSVPVYLQGRIKAQAN